jgi:hypothetical protein
METLPVVPAEIAIKKLKAELCMSSTDRNRELARLRYHVKKQQTVLVLNKLREHRQ